MRGDESVWFVGDSPNRGGIWYNYADVGFETRHSSFLHESKGDGTVTLAGKLGTYSVSGSTTFSFNNIADGVLKADFVPFVTVGRAKKALSINCSLDLNRSAGASAGTAKLVE
jgi:hypothetical protein